MTELELEKTYLLQRLPDGIEKCQFEEIYDSFIPIDSDHPVIRLRHRGDRYEITKKVPAANGDASQQTEDTIKLTKTEFDALNVVPGLTFRKRRYYCTINGFAAEVDVYLDKLEGLALVDFEFQTETELNAFVMPGICLVDVTQDKTFAGGMLAGKSYADLTSALGGHNYRFITPPTN